MKEWRRGRGSGGGGGGAGAEEEEEEICDMYKVKCNPEGHGACTSQDNIHCN